MPSQVPLGARKRSVEAIAADWTAYLGTRKDPTGPIRPVDVLHMLIRLEQQQVEHGCGALAGEIAIAQPMLPGI